MSVASKPVDMSHLAQYTGGDARLDSELLTLFSKQCAEALEKLELLFEKADTKGWRDTAHSLKGAAAGIGAFAVAEWAGRAEASDPAAEKADAADCLAQLRGRCEVAQAFIAAYLER